MHVKDEQLHIKQQTVSPPTGAKSSKHPLTVIHVIPANGKVFSAIWSRQTTEDIFAYFGTTFV